MDYPYFIFYLIMLLLSYSYWQKRNVMIMRWSFVIAFIFFAFRAPVVGADTWDYVRYLTGERNFYNFDARPLEPLFIFYRNIMCNITSSRFVVMVMNTIISFAPLYYITKKNSYNPPLTILLFYLMGGLDVYFVGLRQIMALSVLYVSLIYCLEVKGEVVKKVVTFVCCTIVAYLFHTASVIYALMLIISMVPFKLNRILCIILIVGSSVFGVVLEKFNVLEVFSLVLEMSFSSVERLNNYLMNDELEEVENVSVLLRISVVALIAFLFIDKEKLSHPYGKIFLIGVVVFNLFVSVPMIHRICDPLYFFGSVFFTWIKGQNYHLMKTKRVYLNILLVLLMFYFTRSQVINLWHVDLNNEKRMNPYYFIFQDYSNHPSIKNL